MVLKYSILYCFWFDKTVMQQQIDIYTSPDGSTQIEVQFEGVASNEKR